MWSFGLHWWALHLTKYISLKVVSILWFDALKEFPFNNRLYITLLRIRNLVAHLLTSIFFGGLVKESNNLGKGFASLQRLLYLFRWYKLSQIQVILLEEKQAIFLGLSWYCEFRPLGRRGMPLAWLTHLLLRMWLLGGGLSSPPQIMRVAFLFD